MSKSFFKHVQLISKLVILANTEALALVAQLQNYVPHQVGLLDYLYIYFPDQLLSATLLLIVRPYAVTLGRCRDGDELILTISAAIKD